MPSLPSDVDAAVSDTYRPGGWNARYVILLTILVFLAELGLMASVYVLNALPQIGEHYRTSQIAWVPTLYFLVAALLAPMTGTLADRYGKRRLIAIALTVASVGFVVSAFAPTFGLLLLGRVLQAPILTFPFLVPSLCRDIFPTRIMPLAASVAITGAGLLGVPLQVFAGDLIERLGFRNVFWLPAIMSVVLLVLVLTFVPESSIRERAGRIDFVGATLLGGGVALVLVAVSFGPTWGWGSPRVVGAAIAGILLLIAWFAQAGRSDYPLVDLRELTSVPISMMLLSAAIGTAMTAWTQAFLPVFALSPTAVGGLGLTPQHQTQIAAVAALATGIAGWATAFVLRKKSPGTTAMWTLVLVIGGFVIGVFARTTVPLFIVTVFTVNLGGAMAMITAYMMVIRVIKPERQAVMSSTVSLSANLLTSIISVAVFAVMNALGTVDPTTGVTVYNSAAFGAGMVIPIGITVVGVIAAAVLRSTRADKDVGQTLRREASKNLVDRQDSGTESPADRSSSESRDDTGCVAQGTASAPLTKEWS
ncbi:MFS transporter [Nocardia cyriacigeorgica]|uniref:MFS transporter n=1 Tax=Nocardia cyriacigeorgica TaxID=135487 RepID=UPI0013D4CD35|nr:MFS transporter [Nocardia cyriacigeorgica]NEW27079.1 MFS transporter [Nocardia cyriacigeorgica]